MPVQKRRITSLAEKLLHEHKILRPPVPVERLIRGQGIHIALKRFDDQSSGFIYINPNSRIPIIGINSKHSETRQRFTMAHELGHFLLHKHDGIHVDDDDFFVRWRDVHSSTGMNEQEREANAFAAELLMPKAFIEVDVKKRDRFSMLDEKDLRDLAKRYGVSFQAFMLRLVNLKIIHAGDFG